MLECTTSKGCPWGFADSAPATRLANRARPPLRGDRCGDSPLRSGVLFKPILQIRE